MSNAPGPALKPPQVHTRALLGREQGAGFFGRSSVERNTWNALVLTQDGVGRRSEPHRGRPAVFGVRHEPAREPPRGASLSVESRTARCPRHRLCGVGRFGGEPAGPPAWPSAAGSRAGAFAPLGAMLFTPCGVVHPDAGICVPAALLKRPGSDVATLRSCPCAGSAAPAAWAAACGGHRARAFEEGPAGPAPPPGRLGPLVGDLEGPALSRPHSCAPWAAGTVRLAC